MTPEQEQLLRETAAKLDRLEASLKNASAFDPLIAKTIKIVVGNSTLAGLSDVDVTGVTNDQVIKWNSTSNLWENAADIDT